MRLCVTSKPATTRESLVSVTFSSAYASWKPVRVRVVVVDAVTVRHSRTKTSERVKREDVPNFSQRDGTRPIAVRLLDTAGGGGGLACRLSGELLAGGLATGGLTSSLLCSCHVCLCRKKCRHYIRGTHDEESTHGKKWTAQTPFLPLLIVISNPPIKGAFERQKCFGGSSGTVGWKCDGKMYSVHTEGWGMPGATHRPR
jgi:hypothetical protein